MHPESSSVPRRLRLLPPWVVLHFANATSAVPAELRDQFPGAKIHFVTFKSNAGILDLLGQTDKLGTLQAGKYADLIAVTKNPLQDITALEQVPFVMKGGVVHKNQINARPR